MTAEGIGAVEYVDARGSSFDMDTILKSGAHYRLYRCDSDTLNTPSNQGVVTFTSAYILSMASSTTFGVQYAFISGSKDVDDFAIDLDLSNQFYKKAQGVIPENTALILSPFDIDTVDFNENTAEDTNIVNEAYQNLVEANGDIVCNSNKITNSTSFKLALMADSFSAMAPVTQINTWINLYIKHNLGVETVIVEFSDVSKYFEEDRINLLLKLGQYGVPIKSELASLAGLNPAKCRSMEYIEEKLGLAKEKWIAPLVSSNIQSGTTENGDGSDGRPTSDGPLSDEGEATKDGDKNKK